MTCPICLEETNNAGYDFCCSRNAHKECLDEYVQRYGLKCMICRKMYKKEKVYFAGKIVKEEWYDTSQIVSGYYYKNKISCDKDALVFPRITICTRKDYVKYDMLKAGFVEKEDLLTCFMTGAIQCGDMTKTHYTFCCCSEDGEHGKGIQRDDDYKENIFQTCMNQIDKSNVVVASINSDEDCHGTFLEIGYAIAKKKPVYIIYEDHDKLPTNFTVKGCIDSLEYGDQDQRKVRMYTIMSKTYRHYQNEKEYLNGVC